MKQKLKLIQEIADKKKNQISKKYLEWDDPSLWNLICNKKIINVFDNIFNKNIFICTTLTLRK